MVGEFTTFSSHLQGRKEFSKVFGNSGSKHISEWSRRVKTGGIQTHEVLGQMVKQMKTRSRVKHKSVITPTFIRTKPVYFA
jgi:cobalamin biosynthesis protein CbiD